VSVQPDAWPLSVDGGPFGVLVSHGFTGSPASMRPWGQALADAGFTVRVPRLPGHGTTWQELNQTRWQDWYAEVDRSLSELRERCDKVAVAGLSMGAALVLRLAQQRPDDVDAIAVVNPAIASTNRQLLALPLLRHVIASTPAIGNDIKKPGMTEGAYDRTPLQALHSVTLMWREVRRDLSRVRAPLLVLRSRVDHVVDPSSARLLIRGVSCPVRREVVLEDSYHVATLDNDAPRIVEESLEFFDSHLRSVPEADSA
jgi:carboxylesterase